MGRCNLLKTFTERAKRALTRAKEAARRLKRGSVGPEHILLGVVEESGGIGEHVLSQLGATPDLVQGLVETIAGQGARPVRDREIRFSPDGKRALEFALQEARSLEHRYIGTEHLLLGVMRMDGGPIVDVIAQLKLTHERVRDEVVRALASKTGPLLQPVDLQPLQPELTRSNVVMCRVNDRDLAAVDALVEAGVRATRSDAAAWLIRAGIEGNKALFDKLHSTVVEIRRLREQAKEITQQLAPEETAPAPTARSSDRRPSEGKDPTGEA